MIRNFGEPYEEHSVFIWYGQQTEISLSWGTHIIGLFLNNPYLKTEAIKDGSLKRMVIKNLRNFISEGFY